MHLVPVDSGRVQAAAECPHGFHGALRQDMTDCRIDHGIADDGMALFDRVPMDGRLGHTTGEDRNPFHALQRFFGPGDGVFRLCIDGRHVLAVGDQHIARRAAQQVFGVAADVHILVAVHADAAHDQEPGLFLPDILNNFFERLAVQQGRLDVGVLGLRDFSGNVEMRLIDLRQSAVDDFLVQLFLLFETEHFARFFVQHAGNAVERRIVKIGVEGRDGFNRHVERLPQLKPRHQPAERIGAAIDGDDDLPAHGRLGIFDDEHVGGSDPPDHPLGVASDHAILDCADAQGAHHHQVVAVA